HHVAAPIERPLPQAAQVEHSLPHDLARDGPGMNANPTHGEATIDDRDFLAHFRRADRALLARRTAADHHQIVFVSLHNRALRRSKKLPLSISTRKLSLVWSRELRIL